MKKNVLTIGITLSTLIMVLLNLQSQAQCHIDDWTALKALYESTDGDNWNTNTGWEVTNGMVPPVDCNLENLYRVGLDESGRVYFLILNDNQLNGSIPTELGNLSKLAALRLSSNQLSGSIPTELGNLSNLTNLWLEDNQLSGSIPPELDNLSNLGALALGSNELSGSIPTELGNLSNLTELSLHSNLLSGSIPPELSNLSKLTVLNLYSNELSGSIPPELGNLSNLTSLSFWGNQLSESIPPELGNLSNLTHLYLSSNEFSGSIPPALGNLSNLTYLQLYSNNLSGCYSDSLMNWCGKFNNEDISEGNNFDASFEDFCDNGANACIPQLGSISGNVSEVAIDILIPINGATIQLQDVNGNLIVSTTTDENGDYEFTELMAGEYIVADVTDGDLPGNSISVTLEPGEVSENNDFLRQVSILQSLCHIADWTALKAIYESTNGDNWYYRTGWDTQIANQSNPPVDCDLSILSGVILDGSGRVIKLYLALRNLSGTIPPEIGNLSNLTELYLYSNQLSGSIPPEMGNLSNLTELYLWHNQLSGSIPPELGNLSNLNFLDLGNNQLSGSIPPELGNLSNLTELSLGGNELSGSIPPELGNLSNLTELSLGSNELSDSIPPELGNLSKLTELSLGGNELNGSIPPELGNLSNLIELDLSRNYQLTGSIPPELGNLSNLTDLRLYSNQLSGSIPPELGNLSNLTDLRLYSNQLSGSIPPELGNLSNLIEMDLSRNYQLTGSIPPELGNLSNLIELVLSDNQLTGSIPPELGNLINLTDLILYGNQLSGSIPPELGNLSNLIELDLSKNYQLVGSIPPELGNIKNLKSLFLNDNQLTGSIPHELGNLMYLINLHLSYNQLSGCYPVNLLNLSAGKNESVSNGNNFDVPWESFLYNYDGSGACSMPNYGNCLQNDRDVLTTLNARTNGSNWKTKWDLTEPTNKWYGVSINGFGCITRLKLGSNELTGNIPPELGNLSKLIELGLGGNELSGSIPTEIGNLSSLTYLQLGSNELSGSIPPELGNLSNLTSLRLYSNQLTASIPPELGNLSNLTYLDLTNNQLSGSIPTELGDLSNLANLKLVVNQLSGSIPPELGNLSNLTYLDLTHNQLSGCYSDSLIDWCGKFGNTDISTGNNFDASFGDFCDKGAIACIPQLGSISGNVIEVAIDILIPAEGATIQLQDVNGNLIVSTTTDINGEYEFTALMSGEYIVADVPDGDLPGNSISVTLEPGEASENNDFLREVSILQSLCHIDDWTALKALYESTDGNNWTYNDGWDTQIANQSNPPVDCDLSILSGVILDGSGRVIKLYLGLRNLSGTIPPELGNLSNLIHLSLWHNKLSGSIPPELGNLSNLTHLSLWYNQLSGSIPPELGNLSNLNFLDLGNNQLSGSIPPELGNLSKLTELSLGGNELSGSIPPELGNLSNLTELSLGSNELSDNIPPEMGNLSKLTELSLGGNELNGSIPPELGNLSNLNYLYLSRNYQLTGSIPPELGNLSNLIELDLSSNYQLTGSIPPELGNLSNLNYLYLSRNYQLTGSIPPELGNLSNLIELVLSDNQLTGSIPPELGNLTNLTDLRLYGNQLSGSIPPELGNLSNLIELDLSKNYQLVGSIPPELGNLKNLKSLFLNDNQLTGSIPHELGNLMHLINLHLSYNQLSGCYSVNLLNLSAGKNESVSNGNNFNVPWESFLYNYDGSGACSMPNYGNCLQNDRDVLTTLNARTNGSSWKTKWDLTEPTNKWYGVTINGFGCITRLNLGSNELTGNIPSELGNLSKLIELDLHGNELSGSIPPELGNLSNLTELSLSGNELSGSIPPETGNLSNLNYLALSFNQLSGSIPPELGNLSNLTILWLVGNELSGNIPPELGNLSNLTSLKLHFNQLTGSIPPELGNLSNLTYLDLMHNQLTGSIPPELGNLSNLTRLELSQNQLTGSITPELGNLSNLTFLELSSNELSGSIPPELGNLSKVILYLNYNNLSGCYSDSLINWCGKFNNANISNGNNFDVPFEDFCVTGSCNGSCNLDDWNALKALYNNTNGENWINNTGWDTQIANQSSPPANCNLAALYGVSTNADGRVDSLNLSNNDLSGTIPPELCELSELVYLNLADNDLSGDIPTAICSFENLTVLDLSSGDLSGEIPEDIFNLTELVELDLSDNKLANELPVEIYELTNLTVLNISENDFEGSLSSAIGNLDSLVILDASNNEFSGSIPDSIGTLIHLEELDLSYNTFSNSIPPEIGDLDNLIALNLSTNLLSGEIPPELGDLENLQYFNVWANALSGEIPEALGNMEEISIFVAAHNKLIGAISDSVANITNLVYFDVSHNQLSDIIPAFSQAATKTVKLNHNLFTCVDFVPYFNTNEPKLDALSYEQSIDIHPTDIDDVYSNIFMKENDGLSIHFESPFDAMDDITYRWIRNGEYLEGNNQNSYEIEQVDSTNVGKYHLTLIQEACLPNNKNVSYTTDPVYVALYNYDLQGNFIEYFEIIEEFDNSAEKAAYDQEVKEEYNGTLVGKCDCNRDLYLYEFPNDNFMRAYISGEIKDVVRLPSTTQPMTDLNYRLTEIDGETSYNLSYEVSIDDGLSNFNSGLDIALIDSGLDETNFEEAANFLYECAPVDNCYEDICAPGFNFVHPYVVGELTVESISDNYTDNIGHGTEGFRLMSKGLDDVPNAKIVPLKILDGQQKKGRLFDLICAVYHAIDHDAQVVNISSGYEGEPSEALKNAITLAKQNDIFIVAAAGNNGLDMDSNSGAKTYPAYYSNSEQLIYYTEQKSTKDGVYDVEVIESIQFDHLISVAAVDVSGDINSNFGSESVTLAGPGVDLHVRGLAAKPEVKSGSSIAAFLSSMALAREIARNKERTLTEIWTDFESNLESNDKLVGKTRTGKQVKFKWDEATVEGCTDREACNYNSYANADDGSCLNCAPKDCTDCPLECPPCPSSTNEPCQTIFDDYAWLKDEVNCDNDEITVYNYSVDWEYIDVKSDDGRILYLSNGTLYCSNDQVESCIETYGLTEIIDDCVCNENQPELCEDINACNNGETAPCNYGDSTCNDPCNCIYGCTDPAASNYNENAELDDNSCQFESSSGTNNTNTNYITLFSDYPWLLTHVDTSNCTGDIITEYDAGSYSFLLIMNGDEGDLYLDNGTFYCNQTPSYSCVEAYGLTDAIRTWACGSIPPAVFGCMDEAARNYDSSATQDDGSCEYDIFGCTDPEASNYNQYATIDDGSCEYLSTCDCNCYTGTFFYQFCGIEDYFFIRLDDGRIFDPYFPDQIKFYPVEGQRIRFDYEVIDTVTTPCTISENPITITCYEEINEGVFFNYPWLETLVNPNGCSDENIYVYDAGPYNFISVETFSSIYLYYQDGTYYCTDAPGFSCVDAYNLSDIVNSWNCVNTPQQKLGQPVKHGKAKQILFNIYPNPASSKVYVELGSNSGKENHLSLYSLKGKILYEKQFEGAHTFIDISNFAKGMYIIEIKNDNEHQIQKLIIE